MATIYGLVTPAECAFGGELTTVGMNQVSQIAGSVRRERAAHQLVVLAGFDPNISRPNAIKATADQLAKELTLARSVIYAPRIATLSSNPQLAKRFAPCYELAIEELEEPPLADDENLLVVAGSAVMALAGDETTDLDTARKYESVGEFRIITEDTDWANPVHSPGFAAFTEPDIADAVQLYILAKNLGGSVAA